MWINSKPLSIRKKQKETAVTKVTAEERAKRMAGNLRGVLLDYEEEIPSVVLTFFYQGDP